MGRPCFEGKRILLNSLMQDNLGVSNLTFDQKAKERMFKFFWYYAILVLILVSIPNIINHSVIRDM